ncbi:MAG: hypothetical protein K9M15_00640 [Candidatus Marinimicrobia bacterium]|nr:hypothetical protein [Candidatus Neomarinimicrobiota bacterium]
MIIKLASIIGKYFRPIGILGISLLFWWSSFCFFCQEYSLETSTLGRIIGNLLFGIVLFLIGLLPISYLRQSKTNEETHENWGMFFVFLIIAVVVFSVHFYLKSKGIDLWFYLLLFLDGLGLA